MQTNQGGYYSMQCMCGFWHPSNLKPQTEWTDEDVKAQVAHQQFHILQQQPYPPQSPSDGQG